MNFASDVTNICGLDEAGRGPMAGPVCAASVILSPDFDCSLLNDSKKLTEKKLGLAMKEILLRARAWSVGWAYPEEIDQINILHASLLAMKRSFEGMTRKETFLHGKDLNPEKLEIIVDGLFAPDLGMPNCKAIVRADATCPAVMAASILAKTARDRMMIRYSWLYPQYGYDQHKGYPTKAHIEAMRINGPSPIQRKSFHLKGEGQLGLF